MHHQHAHPLAAAAAHLQQQQQADPVTSSAAASQGPGKRLKCGVLAEGGIRLQVVCLLIWPPSCPVSIRTLPRLQPHPILFSTQTFCKVSGISLLLLLFFFLN